MPQSRDQSMLVRAATLYYLEGKSQAEVASAIGVSRSNVSRVLADARRSGIVDIRINDPFGRATDLEQALLRQYRIRGCLIAPSVVHDTELSRVGALGATWLMENLPHDGSIAISWGASVQALVDEIPDDPVHPSIEVLPLVGGLSIVDSARDGNVLVRFLAGKLGARHRRLYAPAVVESRESRVALMSEPSINTVLRAAEKASVAIVGIGSTGAGASSSIIESMHLSPEDQTAFLNSGVVGDCCTRFFDSAGVAVESEVNDRVIAIDLDKLREIPTILAVASGARKANAVHGAVLGGLVDILVVDSALATAMLALT